MSLLGFSLPNLSIIVLWIILYITESDAKCQIVCNRWADDTFQRCDDAEIKCASNLPQGFYCTEFSNTRPIRCLDMIAESEKSAESFPPSSPQRAGFPLAAGPSRPRRYRRPVTNEYRVDKAPHVELLNDA